MRGGWRLAILPPAFVTLVFTSVARAGAINFDFYPKDARQCLYKAAGDSNCDSGTVETTNACLCSNGGNFVTKTAECLGKNDKKDLSQVYLTMRDACSESKTPLTVLEEQYLANAGVTDKTLTSVGPKPTQSPSKTRDAQPSATSTQEAVGGEGGTGTEDQRPGDKNSNNMDKSMEDGTWGSSGPGMSTGAKAGIIAGGVVGGLAVLAALGFFILRYRRKRYGEESHPMLPPENGHMSLVPTAAETSALMAIDTPKGDWPNDTGWRPTSNETGERKSAFNWESPYDLAYPGTLKVGQTPSPPGSPPLTSHSSVSHLSTAYSRRSGVFELQGSDRQSVEGSAVPPEASEETAVIPIPRASAATSNRYSGSGWTEINPEPETPATSRANSSR